MLNELMDGRALTASELARIAASRRKRQLAYAGWPTSA